MSVHPHYAPPEYYTGSRVRVPRTYREALKLTLTSGGPLISIFLIITGGISRFYVGQWNWLDAAAVLTVIGGWTFIEWAMHNYVLHARPLPVIGWRMPSILSRIHARHHIDPWDVRTLHFKGSTVLGGWILIAMPLVLLVPVGQALTFVTCLFLMIEMYQWFHLLVHSKVQVKSAYMRRAIQNHINHHVTDGQRWMGVSTFWADEILETNTSSVARPLSSDKGPEQGENAIGGASEH